MASRDSKLLDNIEVVVEENPDASGIELEIFARILIRKLEKLVQDPEWVKGFEEWKAKKEKEKLQEEN